ncbi:MAG: DUF1501 domain-containing protein [Verrucomicrobia bacterium]|nr:DUF1501 domain-containing protein [Verrucomicrobiota bacterium]
MRGEEPSHQRVCLSLRHWVVRLCPRFFKLPECCLHSPREFAVRKVRVEHLSVQHPRGPEQPGVGAVALLADIGRGILRQAVLPVPLEKLTADCQPFIDGAAGKVLHGAGSRSSPFRLQASGTSGNCCAHVTAIIPPGRPVGKRAVAFITQALWGGGFGRTPSSQGEIRKANFGGYHHPRCSSLWLAGGGVKPGILLGATDDFGYNIAEDPISVHDLHATMLHLLGIEHTGRWRVGAGVSEPARALGVRRRSLRSRRFRVGWPWRGEFRRLESCRSQKR